MASVLEKLLKGPSKQVYSKEEAQGILSAILPNPTSESSSSKDSKLKLIESKTLTQVVEENPLKRDVNKACSGNETYLKQIRAVPYEQVKNLNEYVAGLNQHIESLFKFENSIFRLKKTFFLNNGKNVKPQKTKKSPKAQELLEFEEMEERLKKAIKESKGEKLKIEQFLKSKVGEQASSSELKDVKVEKVKIKKPRKKTDSKSDKPLQPVSISPTVAPEGNESKSKQVNISVPEKKEFKTTKNEEFSDEYKDLAGANKHSTKPASQKTNRNQPTLSADPTESTQRSKLPKTSITITSATSSEPGQDNTGWTRVTGRKRGNHSQKLETKRDQQEVVGSPQLLFSTTKLRGAAVGSNMSTSKESLSSNTSSSTLVSKKEEKPQPQSKRSWADIGNNSSSSRSDQSIVDSTEFPSLTAQTSSTHLKHKPKPAKTQKMDDRSQDQSPKTNQQVINASDVVSSNVDSSSSVSSSSSPTKEEEPKFQSSQPHVNAALPQPIPTQVAKDVLGNGLGGPSSTIHSISNNDTTAQKSSLAFNAKIFVPNTHSVSNSVTLEPKTEQNPNSSSTSVKKQKKKKRPDARVISKFLSVISSLQKTHPFDFNQTDVLYEVVFKLLPKYQSMDDKDTQLQMYMEAIKQYNNYLATKEEYKQASSAGFSNQSSMPIAAPMLNNQIYNPGLVPTTSITPIHSPDNNGYMLLRENPAYHSAIGAVTQPQLYTQSTQYYVPTEEAYRQEHAVAANNPSPIQVLMPTLHNQYPANPNFLLAPVHPHNNNGHILLTEAQPSHIPHSYPAGFNQHANFPETPVPQSSQSGFLPTYQQQRRGQNQHHASKPFKPSASSLSKQQEKGKKTNVNNPS